ncbi:RHS repeat protein [Xenorhabdus bovienii]|uniref:RHS repeat-associated core domain-containing protein n=1 Tax=Xenorhabdus bovienii TaxID=40576 RepID=UPI0023B2CB42|nr:RHS repeat-associated core domain-containing protein [Xenorhabdus bovienii]MDE9493582.1 RHS repeat protein [Xenorhabdus bovienii]MDE9502119.1 RHS repeat protein [Xenorhabdus bovienii]MDE9569409.1 RHS repeat protein [Xenorhabdus bovienii]
MNPYREDIALHQKTPEVTVLDNRGLTVRELRYHRHPNTPTTTDERITRHRFTLAGQLAHSIDPRLFDLQQTDNTVNPNMVYETALTGEVVRIRSVDAGNTLMLNDITGRPVLAINATEVTRTWQYEHETLPGRPLSITEQPADEAARITERFVWAGNSQAEKNSNLAGQCVRHYDTAGLNQTNSIALNGIPLSVTRRLLPDGTDADWQGNNESAWNDRLAPESFTTLSTADATGAVLTTTDAAGNLQRVAYDVAGLLTGSWLRLAGGTEQVIVKSLAYSAAGQKLREEHGNGVVTTYTYEPETQRLVGIKTERPPGHAAGGKVLQDLRYEYDPVGNVVKVTNDAEATRFWRNQKVVPENTYTYDSLYQLVAATGREMANIGQQSTLLPTPSLIDSSTYSNYSRTYNYDCGGNLTQIRHSAPATGNNYTTDITVSDHSNRAVLNTLTDDPAKVDALFTTGGQQNQLLPGQNLVWTPRGELLKVTPVVRDGQPSDHESYRYDSGNQRVIKTTTQQTNNSTQTQRTLYLPGLERRTTTNSGTIKEALHTLIVGEAGRAQVRILHWESGKPNDISNNQMRYSYDNLVGSSGLEVDGDGNLISLEEYYPYGGTAVWTARSQTEVGYKTVRYSGKERDATGLYYYGYRYYQPWVGRWLSADPAGTVDGLNLYTMVRNNPATFRDKDGLIREGQEAFLPVSESHTDLDTAKKMINKSTENILQKAQEGTESVNKIKSEKAKGAAAEVLKFTNNKLKGYAAHAVVVSELSDRVIYKRQFLNLPGSLSKNNLFPGVELMEGNSSSPQSYKVINSETFLNGIQDAYSSKKIYPLRNQKDAVKTPEFTETPDPLHPIIKERIIEHLEKNKNILPTTAGIAGLHAEVQALNFVLHRLDALDIDRDEGLTNTYIYTKRLVGKERNVDFPACHNCSGILSGREQVMTGRVSSHTH